MNLIDKIIFKFVGEITMNNFNKIFKFYYYVRVVFILLPLVKVTQLGLQIIVYSLLLYFLEKLLVIYRRFFSMEASSIYKLINYRWLI